MKKTIITLVAVLAVTLLFTTCEWVPGTGTFAFDLRGTWKTNTPTSPLGYVGELEIGYDTIKITGYTGTLGWGVSETTRPFKGYTTGTTLDARIEKNAEQNPDLVDSAYDGTLQISDKGEWQVPLISFRYYRSAGYPRDYFIRFEFGDKEQILKKVE